MGDDAADQEMDTQTGGADEAYIGMYLLKYVCARESCFGTLIPTQGTDSYKCNMCSVHRTEQDFMAAVEQQEDF